MSEFKVLLAAWKIPLRSVVTKKGGGKEYILRDKLEVYREMGHEDLQVTMADIGARFLVSDTGNTTIVDYDTELMWLTNREELQKFLEEV